MDPNSYSKPLDKRRRETHPEHLAIGGETFVRNDVRAKALHMSERSLNRGDRQGAPFLFIGAVKYRPVERHDAFILASIQTRKPQPPKRRREAGRGRA
jgi:hypothetical protein